MCLPETRKERRAHLNLESNCIERGGNSTMFRGILAVHLGTEIFEAKKVCLCHACHNPNCSNPEHLYWGTYQDNIQDQKDNGTWQNIWERRVAKHGLEEAKKQNARNANPSKAGAGNKGKKKSLEHRKKIAEAIKRKYNNNLK